jgi:hypothetical protein
VHEAVDWVSNSSVLPPFLKTFLTFYVLVPE